MSVSVQQPTPLLHLVPLSQSLSQLEWCWLKGRALSCLTLTPGYPEVRISGQAGDGPHWV